MNIKREDFTVNGTRLILEDRINTFHPSRSERILWIAGTSAYYSVAPLCPARHELLCFTYCADALKMYDHDFLENALILGCGGGAVPRWILEEYPTAIVDVVDRSPEIISICKKYFLQRWEDSDRLRIHCVDAQDYMPPEYKYQFIFCDLFDGQNLAPVVYDQDFAEKLRYMISDDGFIMINCGWYDPDTIRKLYRTLFRHVQTLDRESWQTQVIEVNP